jgi:hypothetical protein
VRPQAVRDEQQVAEFHFVAGFHPLDGGSVDAAGVGEGFLGHAEVESAYADAVAGAPAGVADPLGLFGWHSANALPIMIISQQQI